MKRALAILLTFITLATGALFAPAATADVNAETTLLFRLNSDGSIDEFITVSSTNNTVNATKCNYSNEYAAKFSQVDNKNQCIFSKHYNPYYYILTLSVIRLDDHLEFRFENRLFEIENDISDILNISPYDLNITSTTVAVPANATVTAQTLSPIEDRDEKFIYYTWEGHDSFNEKASVRGTLPLPEVTSTPTSKPSHTPAPVFTATPSAEPSDSNLADATPTASGSINTFSPQTAATPKGFQSLNDMLRWFLLIVSVVCIVIIVGIFLLAQISKNSTSAYMPLSAATLYDDQSSSSAQPQTYKSHPNQPRSFTDNQASTQSSPSGTQTRVSTRPGKDSQTDLNSTHKL